MKDPGFKIVKDGVDLIPIYHIPWTDIVIVTDQATMIVLRFDEWMCEHALAFATDQTTAPIDEFLEPKRPNFHIISGGKPFHIRIFVRKDQSFIGTARDGEVRRFSLGDAFSEFSEVTSRWPDKIHGAGFGGS
ncbi:MAG: hypothetical protein ABIH41_04930 [Nanoarchaeota archaeon]